MKALSSSENEAVAARSEKPGVTAAGRLDAGEELIRGMGAAVLATLDAVVIFRGNAGSRRFENVQRRAIAAEHFHRRPLGQYWSRRRRVRTEFFGRMNNLSAYDGEDRFDGFDTPQRL